MKKIFTLMLMCVMAVAAQAKITIYVQCETAPYLWTWGAAGGTFDNVGEWPGQLQLTDKYTHPDTGEEFWTYSFTDEITQISFLFNNGEATNTKQTSDVKDVVSDRYFLLTWDDGTGSVGFEDVTEDYTEIPDAQVNSLGVSGNHVGWDDTPTVFAEIVEAGKTFKYVLVPDAEATSVTFKFRPNGSSWLGYWDVYYDAAGEAVEGKTSNAEAPEWLEYTSDGNFKIDYKKYTADDFTFTMTWNGGKSATLNWAIATDATNLQKLDPQPSTVSTWTVAGEAAICGGSGWDPTDTNNDMIPDNENNFRLTRTAVEITEAKTYYYKIVADHSWDESYPSSNAELTIEAPGTYDITFTFNSETKEVGASVAATGTGIKTVSLNSAKTAAIYNLQGQRVDANYRGIAIQNGKKFMVK